MRVPGSWKNDENLAQILLILIKKIAFSIEIFEFQKPRRPLEVPKSNLACFFDFRTGFEVDI